MPGKHKRVPCRFECGATIRVSDNKSGICASCLTEQRTVDHALKSAESFDVQGDEATLTKTVPARVKNEKELIEVCGIDTSVWEVERFTCQAMEQTSVPRATRPTAGDKWVRPSSEPVTVVMFNVKAWLRRKVEVAAARVELASLLEDLKAGLPAPLPVSHKVGGGHLLMPSIPDLHVGKLAWAPETGGEHYDSRIAVELYHEALAQLVELTSRFSPDRIVLPIGNDMINSDNVQLTTTKGTPQSSDGRFHKSFGMVRKMLQSGISFLRTVAPVDVVVVPGNHDTLSMWFMGELLRTIYYADEHVTVNNDPILWKFYEYHRNMFMFLHGDKGKRPNYPNVMARMQPKMWGRTEHREVHTGHLHESKTVESHGTKIVTSPALCPPDAWHAENLYVGNSRAAEAFVYHPQAGRVASATFTVQERRPE